MLSLTPTNGILLTIRMLMTPPAHNKTTVVKKRFAVSLNEEIAVATVEMSIKSRNVRVEAPTIIIDNERDRVRRVQPDSVQ